MRLEADRVERAALGEQAQLKKATNRFLVKKPFKCCCQYLNCFPLLTADKDEPKADWQRNYLIVVFPSESCSQSLESSSSPELRNIPKVERGRCANG